MESEIKAAMAHAVNPLHEMAIIAKRLAELMPDATNGQGDTATPWSAGFSTEDFPVVNGTATAYPSKESGGVAGLYYALESFSNWQTIFANDLAWDIHGVDAVAYNSRTDEYLLCEAKGTSLAKLRSVCSYLKATKTKGRQLSWQWCWASFVDCAGLASTAPLFLRLLKPFLEGRVQRMLAVTQLKQDAMGCIISATKTWGESELCQFSDLDAPYDLSKQRLWLDEMLKADPEILP